MNKDFKYLFSSQVDNKYLKKYADNKALCGNSPHEGLTAARFFSFQKPC
jgi:hypothetical protein